MRTDVQWCNGSHPTRMKAVNILFLRLFRLFFLKVSVSGNSAAHGAHHLRSASLSDVNNSTHLFHQRSVRHRHLPSISRFVSGSRDQCQTVAGFSSAPTRASSSWVRAAGFHIGEPRGVLGRTKGQCGGVLRSVEHCMLSRSQWSNQVWMKELGCAPGPTMPSSLRGKENTHVCLIKLRLKSVSELTPMPSAPEQSLDASAHRRQINYSHSPSICPLLMKNNWKKNRMVSLLHKMEIFSFPPEIVFLWSDILWLHIH